jgi:putative membrane protein
MKGFLVRWIVNALALVVVVYTIRGIEVESLFATIVAALVLGIINTFFRPLIIVLTVPFSIATFGGFILVINGFLLWMVSKIVKGFTIQTFWAAFWGALVFSVISYLLNLWINQQGHLEIRIIRRKSQ